MAFQNSLYVPVPLKGKTEEELGRKILKFQSEQGGKCAIISMYYVPGKDPHHVCWIMPIKSLGHAGSV